METTILIALGGLLLTSLAMFSGVMYRLGRLSARVDLLFEAVAQNREDINQARQEFREELQRLREEFLAECQRLRQEFRQENQRLREEMRQGFQQIRDEIRRSNQQLLHALASHSHNPESGAAIFSTPPLME